MNLRNMSNRDFAIMIAPMSGYVDENITNAPMTA